MGGDLAPAQLSAAHYEPLGEELEMYARIPVVEESCINRDMKFVTPCRVDASLIIHPCFVHVEGAITVGFGCAWLSNSGRESGDGDEGSDFVGEERGR